MEMHGYQQEVYHHQHKLAVWRRLAFKTKPNEPNEQRYGNGLNIDGVLLQKACANNVYSNLFPKSRRAQALSRRSRNATLIESSRCTCNRARTISSGFVMIVVVNPPKLPATHCTNRCDTHGGTIFNSSSWYR
uniref:Uncharacterized protein n=1 Tax=Anopheles coluzzii TaxID=1518534 RepID=A0A8W7PQ87_ANOCL